MASNLTVNLGGGKKQLVKTTPTMILRQVVNSVCEKQGYAEPESYGLKYVPMPCTMALVVVLVVVH